ncbi:methyltransferase-domain-containing protein [Mycena floridula]|nr:methyltransferase-domain-containing protein [Mycena floridula]
MSNLFSVAGWSVTGEVAESSSSKKRKRQPESSASRLAAAELNLDKLVNKLKAKPDASRLKKNKKPPNVDKKKEISHPKPLMSKSKARQAHTESQASGSTLSLRPQKRVKFATEDEEPESPPKKKLKVEMSSSSSSESLTPLQKGMKQSLDGARFRIINETFYKSDSQAAQHLVEEDPNVFEEVVGFRHQVQSWPTNPVEHYISVLSEYPSKTVIADLGCGDAAIARALIPKGMTVLSYDLVSNNPFVVQADICRSIPLPGRSEGAEAEAMGQIVDVVVCALSLMGTNWTVASRFTDLNQFTSLLGSIGFSSESKDTTNTHFTLFEFKRVPRVIKDNEWERMASKGSLLKPCEYKRR